MNNLSLNALLKMSSSDGSNIIIGRLYEHRIKEQAEEKPYPIKEFHASSITKCDRLLVAKILFWDKMKPDFTPELLEIFENGKYTHKRIQTECIKAGLVPKRGQWPKPRRKVKGQWVYDIDRELEPWAVEIPIKYPKWSLKGTCDLLAKIDGNYYIVEIKSMNSFKFNQIRQPEEDHYAQGQAYYKMAEETLGIKIKGIVFIYECKDSQKRKEFLVLPNKNFVVKLGMRCMKLKKYVENKKFPPRQYQKDSRDCKYCEAKTWCWGD